MKKHLLCLCAISISQPVLATVYDESEYARLVQIQTPARPTDSGGGSGHINPQGMGDSGVNPTPTDGINPGRGYSSDTEAIAPTTCYNPISITRGAQTSQINFSTAQSVSNIASMFNVSTSLSSGYGIFGMSGMMSYLDEVSENNYSMSFNYSQKVSQAVQMQYSYDPMTSLNSTGQAIYANGTNPMFRLFCGDTLITSYEEGAGLILSMQVNFSDATSKQTFKTAVGGSVLGFATASAQIQNIATAYHLQGQLVVQAYQIGGSPQELSMIFKNPSNIFKCDINNTAACQSAATTILDYASNAFPNQFGKDNNIWTSPLVPTGGLGLDFRVSDFGMILAPTYATDDVKNKRASLIETYKKYDNYANYFQTVNNYYPGTLDEYIKSQVQNNINLSQANVSLLEQAPGYGSSIDCWKFPFRCSTVYPTLMSQINEVTFDASNLLYCDDPNLHFNVSDVCGNNAEQRQYYSGNFFTASKSPSPGTWTDGRIHIGSPPPVCYARAKYVSDTWHDCAGPQQYGGNTSFQLSDFIDKSKPM